MSARSNGQQSGKEIDITEYKLACACGSSIFIYSYNTLENKLIPKSHFSPHDAKINCVQWNHNNKVIASGSDDRTVVLCLENGTNIGVTIPFTREEMTERILTLSLSAGSRYLAYGGTDRLVRIVDLRTKEMIKTFTGHTDTITCMTLSPDAKYIASGSEDGDVAIHNFETNTMVKKLQYSKHAIRSLQFSSKKKSLLATGSDDGSVIVWDVNTGRRHCSFLVQHSAPCVAVAFSAKRELLLVSVGADKMIFCYDIESHSQVRSYEVGQVLTCMSFLEDGCTIAVGTASGQVIIYDLRTETKPIQTIQVQERSPIAALSFQAKISSKTLTSKSSPKKMINNSSTTPVTPITSSTANIITEKKIDEPKLKQTEETISPKRRSAYENNEDVFSPIKSKQTSSFPTIDMQVQSNKTSSPVQEYLSTSVITASTVTRAASVPFSSSLYMKSPSVSDDVFSPQRNNDNILGSSLTSSITSSYKPITTPILSDYRTKTMDVDSDDDEIKQRVPSPRKSVVHVDDDNDDEMYTDTSPTKSIQYNFMNALEVTDKGTQRSDISSPVTGANTTRGIGSGAATSFQSQFQKAMIEDIMMTLQKSLHNDIRNMHLDMLQQFHNQNERANEQITSLKLQVEKLQEEISEMREHYKRNS